MSPASNRSTASRSESPSSFCNVITNAGDGFRITGASWLHDDMALSWPGLSGRVYRVWAFEKPGDTGTNITELTGRDGVMSITNLSALTSNTFLRLDVRLAP